MFRCSLDNGRTVDGDHGCQAVCVKGCILWHAAYALTTLIQPPCSQTGAVTGYLTAGTAAAHEHSTHDPCCSVLIKTHTHQCTENSKHSCAAALLALSVPETYINNLSGI